MAGSWVIAGAGLLGFLKLWKKKNNLERPQGSASSRCRLLPVLAIAAFSLLAAVYYGTAMVAVLNFHGKAHKLERTLLGAGRAICDAIRRVMATLGKIRTQVCPGDGDGNGNEPLCHLTRLASKMLKAKLTDLKRTIRKEGYLFDIALVVLGIAASVENWVDHGNRCLLDLNQPLLGSRWHPFIPSHVSTVTILVRFIDDTCSAFEEFQLNPRNSSLGKMLPCPHSTSSNKMAEGTGILIHNLINLELGKYKKMVEHRSFEMVKSYGISSQSFVNVIPGAKKLLHCTIIKEAFEKIVAYQCRPLKSLVKLLCAAGKKEKLIRQLPNEDYNLRSNLSNASSLQLSLSFSMESIKHWQLSKEGPFRNHTSKRIFFSYIPHCSNFRAPLFLAQQLQTPCFCTLKKPAESSNALSMTKTKGEGEE
ncbi:hypothetical protein HPP92_019979 [Vanilla planifolia]|uniref:Uncharacterized protein n=1 Tax=Vanilla planifolia TaxID=51239 RepID=A0A835Q3W3_VANPL|nr:hypothetical protein HPP92_019979 [Vanilla planifolia]